MELSDEENVKIVWAAGKDWVVKRKNRQYYYRPDREYGEWTLGIPPDTLKTEIDILFEN